MCSFHESNQNQLFPLTLCMLFLQISILFLWVCLLFHFLFEQLIQKYPHRFQMVPIKCILMCLILSLFEFVPNLNKPSASLWNRVFFLGQFLIAQRLVSRKILWDICTLSSSCFECFQSHRFLLFDLTSCWLSRRWLWSHYAWSRRYSHTNRTCMKWLRGYRFYFRSYNCTEFFATSFPEQHNHTENVGQGQSTVRGQLWWVRSNIHNQFRFGKSPSQ